MFDLTNSRDFYAILVEDFDDFMAEPHSARRAVHCAITAYHLHEWVWGDWLKHDYDVWKALGIRFAACTLARSPRAIPTICATRNSTPSTS